MKFRDNQILLSLTHIISLQSTVKPFKSLHKSAIPMLMMMKNDHFNDKKFLQNFNECTHSIYRT